MLKQILLVLLILSLAYANRRNYTTFQQCDASWGQNKLGQSNKTICQEGSLISSVAMILNTFGITVNGQQSNPGTLNSWLKSHAGYVQGDLFVWDSVSPLGLIFYNFTYRNNITFSFDAEKNVILNVNKGSNWVLMTGYSGNTIYVNDPGFSKTSYDISEIEEAGVYNTVTRTILQQIFLDKIKN